MTPRAEPPDPAIRAELLDAAEALERVERTLEKSAPHLGAWSHVVLQAVGDCRHWSRRVKNIVALLDRP